MDRLLFLGSSLLALCTLMLSTLAVTFEITTMPAQLIDKNANVAKIDYKLSRVEAAQRLALFNRSTWDQLRGDLLMQKGAIGNSFDTDLLMQAADLYKQSISVEPATSQLWAKFALSKSLLKQTDNEFDSALQKAFLYGRSEADVNEIIVNIGMANTQSLDVESLLLVKEAVRHLYTIKTAMLLQTAANYGQLHMVCLWVSDLTPVRPVCQKELEL